MHHHTLMALCTLLVTACGVEVRVDQDGDPTADRQVEEALNVSFDAFSSGDSAGLYDITTDDFALVEYGRWPINTLLKWMLGREEGAEARFVTGNLLTRVYGSHAYVVYDNQLTAVSAESGDSSRSFLESALFRIQGGSWKVALIHSTRMDSE